MENLTNIKKKICLLGAFGVGKTSLVQRFVYDRFDEKYLSTLGVSISQKIMPPIKISGKSQLVQYTFLIWDIAGMEKFSPMIKTYFQGADAGIAVADLAREETLSQMQTVGEKFLGYSPEAKLLLVGNKADLLENSDPQKEELAKLAGQMEAGYFLSSAKTGWGVPNIFIKLSKILSVVDGSD